MSAGEGAQLPVRSGSGARPAVLHAMRAQVPAIVRAHLGPAVVHSSGSERARATHERATRRRHRFVRWSLVHVCAEPATDRSPQPLEWSLVHATPSTKAPERTPTAPPTDPLRSVVLAGLRHPRRRESPRTFPSDQRCRWTDADTTANRTPQRCCLTDADTTANRTPQRCRLTDAGPRDPAHAADRVRPRPSRRARARARPRPHRRRRPPRPAATTPSARTPAGRCRGSCQTPSGPARAG